MDSGSRARGVRSTTRQRALPDRLVGSRSGKRKGPQGPSLGATAREAQNPARHPCHDAHEKTETERRAKERKTRGGDLRVWRVWSWEI
jgi:hypothetical protein